MFQDKSSDYNEEIILYHILHIYYIPGVHGMIQTNLPQSILACSSKLILIQPELFMKEEPELDGMRNPHKTSPPPPSQQYPKSPQYTSACSIYTADNKSAPIYRSPKTARTRLLLTASVRCPGLDTPSPQYSCPG